MDIVNATARSNYPAQTASYTGVAGNTGDWAFGPEAVMVWADSAAYIEVGSGAVATTGSIPIPANTVVYIKVPPDANAPWRVSAIKVAANGNVYAKPINR